MNIDDLKKQIEANLGKFAGQPNTEEIQSDAMKVLLPLIRKVSPTLIADDIVNVQPMVAPKVMQIGFTDEIDHPYWVEPLVSSGAIFHYGKFDAKHQEQIDWCLETFKEGDWMASSYKFYFKEEKDRDWFVLRWS